jgi:hypothetical protein
MRCIITEGQYNNLVEGKESLLLRRRYTIIKRWLYENLPMIDFSFYDLEEEEDLIMMYVINYFLEEVRENDDMFEEYHKIPQSDLINFIMEHFRDMIINYVRGV